VFFFIPSFRRRRVVYVERTCRQSYSKIARPNWAIAWGASMVVGAIGMAILLNGGSVWLLLIGCVLIITTGVMAEKPYPAPPFLPLNERMWHSDRR
jgi:hypothetical protein